MLLSIVGVLFDGIAYGSLLFLMSVGLSVTMGLMNFVNLAHGAFAMIGGYLFIELLNGLNIPFLVALPLVFFACGFVGWVLERLLYQRLYQAQPLDQVLFSIGLTFMCVALATFVWGPGQASIQIPAGLKGQIQIAGLSVGVYRVFLIAVVFFITAALWLLIERTRFGAKIRASVDNQTAARGLGINVNRIFSLTFALGSALGGIGGALGVDVLGLDPTFPLKYMVYFLIVVAVGGAGTIRGPLIAALILGVFDVAGKYYVPEVGAFVIYGLMVALLLLFPRGLVVRRN